MSNEKKKDCVIVLGPNTDGVTALLVELRKRENIEILEPASADEAAQVVTQFMPCMLIASVNDNQAIPTSVTLFKRLEKGIKYGLLKSMVVSKVKNKQLGSLISSLGVTDYIEEPAPVRTINFKANIQLKAVEAIRKREEEKKKSKENVSFKKDSDAKDSGSMSMKDQPAPNKKPALSLGEDTFLFKNNGVKKSGKKLMIEMDGPPPESGDWVEHEAKPDGQTSWRWVPKDEEGKPTTPPENKDGWVHEGDKPQFSEASGKWQFQSEKPDISLYKGKDKLASKVSTNADGSLEVAEDSKNAEENIEAKKKKFKSKKPGAKDEKSLELQSDTPEEKPQVLGDKTFENDNKDSKELSVKNKKRKKISLKDLGDKLNSAQGSENEEEEEEESLLTAQKDTNTDTSEENLIGGKKDAEPKKNSEKEIGAKEAPDPEKEKLIGAKENVEQKPVVNPALAFLSKKKNQPKTNVPDTVGASKAETAENPIEEKKDHQIGTTKKPTELKKHSLAQDKLVGVNELKSDEPAKDNADAKTKKFKSKRKKISLADLKNKLGKSADDTLTADEIKASGEEIELSEEELKNKKKAVLSEIQEELNKPLNENLTEEEIVETAKKHKLDPLTASKKDLAKKRRLDKLEALKGKLQSFDEDAQGSTEEELPEPVQHDLKAEDPENTWSKKGDLGNKINSRRMNAHDSEEAIGTAENDDKIAGLKAKLNKKNGKDAQEEVFFYKTSEELKLKEAAWESTGSYYVFLAGGVRYHGFAKLEELLPLWTYAGTQVPVFIAKEDRWRFSEIDAVCATSVKDIPFEVVDFLNAINAQVKQNSTISAAKDKVAQLDEEKRAKEEEVQEGRKKVQNAAAEKLARLKEKLGDEVSDHKDDAVNSEDFSEQTSEEIKTEITSTDDRKKKIQEKLDEISAELEKTKNEEITEEKTEADQKDEEKNYQLLEENFSKEEKARKKKKMEEKLADLKSKLENSEKITEEEFQGALKEETSALEENNAENSSDAQKPKKENITSIEEIQPKAEKTDNVAPVTDDLINKVGNKSEGIKKFLENRKEKAKTALPEVIVPRKSEATLKGYLGLSVAISDAIYERKHIKEMADKFTSLISQSMGNCFAFMTEKSTDGSHTVLGTTNPLYPKGSSFKEDESKENRVQNMIYHEVKISHGETVENLGYLILEPCPPRTEFNYKEIDSLKKVSEMLANYWNDYKKAELNDQERSKAA